MVQNFEFLSQETLVTLGREVGAGHDSPLPPQRLEQTPL
jgi:hypothetical protein